MSTNFQDVVAMNEVFGNPRGNVKNLDWNKVAMYVHLIGEELAEVDAALMDGDIKELTDGVLDVLVVAYGLAHTLGIDADEGMRRVYASNMSKLCPDEQSADKTRAFYQQTHGFDTYAEQVTVKGESMWVVKVSDDCHSTRTGKFFPKGKFLKCVTTFKEPDLVGDGLYY